MGRIVSPIPELIMNAVRQYVTSSVCGFVALVIARQSDIRDTYHYCMVGTSVISLLGCTPAECLLHCAVGLQICLSLSSWHFSSKTKPYRAVVTMYQ